jgi:hypothetical protein
MESIPEYTHVLHMELRVLDLYDYTQKGYVARTPYWSKLDPYSTRTPLFVAAGVRWVGGVVFVTEHKPNLIND